LQATVGSYPPNGCSRVVAPTCNSHHLLLPPAAPSWQLPPVVCTLAAPSWLLPLAASPLANTRYPTAQGQHGPPVVFPAAPPHLHAKAICDYHPYLVFIFRAAYEAGPKRLRGESDPALCAVEVLTGAFARELQLHPGYPSGLRGPGTL
jgi:hypothetical protein